MTPEKIRTGFLARLGTPAPGTPAASFKANLEAGDTLETAPARVSAFFAACKARDKKGFLADVMKINSLRRDQARQMEVLHRDETLPFDELTVDPDARLHPRTCSLTTSFTP